MKEELPQTSKLILGNCLDEMTKMQEKSIDMIFADPPYFLSNDGLVFSSNHEKTVTTRSVNKGEWDRGQGFVNDVEFHRKWIGECHRLLSNNGTIWITGTYHNIYQCGYILQEMGFQILNEIIWMKTNPMPNFSCRCFAASHETLIWAKKNRKSKHTFNYEQMKFGDFPEDRLKNPNKQMKSVWSLPTPKKTEKEFGKHPTQKPLLLLERIILSSTNEGDTVFDPFMGSGTTGVASVKHLRNFVGIEQEQTYFDIAEKRIVHEGSRQTQMNKLFNKD